MYQFTKRLGAFSMVLALPLAAIAGEPATPGDGATELDTVVVTATKTERTLKETAGSVNVITDVQMQEQLVQDISDMVRYLPGVSVTDDPTRFGLGGFSIRGIGGNRVLIEVDGVPVSDAFAIGSFSSAGRNFVDPELLKQVEILRGSASALYGSDAVGGVVAFTTKDAQDYLSDADSFLVVKGGYNSDDASTVATVIGAWGDAEDGLLLAVSRRDGEQRDNQGEVETQDAARTAPNPQEYSSNNLLAKGTFVRGANTFRLTLDGTDSQTLTDVYSSLGTQDFSALYGIPYIVSTDNLSGDDTRERVRLSGAWDFAVPTALFDAGSVQLYVQNSETRQITDETRTTTVFGVPGSVQRYREFTFEQDLVGANLLFRKAFENETGANHLLVYGVEIEHTDTVQQRDGSETDLQTGVTSNTVGPDVFPVRDFPASTTLEAGLYVQDEISWDAFTLIPGVRLDYYRLSPEKNDQIFLADNPGITPVEISETNVSPKLGMLYDFTSSWTGFFQYAHGFRAPPYNDVNVGFTNLAFGYTAIPNPDLKPETSNHYELGLRRAGERSGVSVAVYYNRYEDFIEPFVSLGVDPVSGLLVFQSQNFTEVTTRGVEVQGHYDLAAVQGLRLIGSLAWSRGENEQTGEPLNSMAPHTAVFGVDYAAPSQRWGVELVSTLVAEQDRVDETGGPLFIPAGYGKLDLLAWYAFTPDVKLHLGVFNLTDKKYWNWSSVNGRPANDPVIDRYSQAGLNASASLRVSF